MALPLGCTVNPAWWTRLCDAVSAVLLHPYQRVTVDLPVYAGWGPTGIPPPQEPRPDLGRYWRLCDCTGTPHRMESDCPRPAPAENARRYVKEDGDGTLDEFISGFERHCQGPREGTK